MKNINFEYLVKQNNTLLNHNVENFKSIKKIYDIIQSDLTEYHKLINIEEIVSEIIGKVRKKKNF